MRSFTSVASDVADEVLPFENRESAVRRLLRQFTRFVEMTGGTTEELKNAQGQMRFEDADVPILKLILSQLAKEEGFAFDFLQRKVDLASIDDTHRLIQQMLDSLATDGLSENDAQAVVNWLDRVFRFSFRVEIENCHRIVDGIAINLLQYPYTYSMEYVNGFYHLLMQAFAKTTVRAIMEIGELAEVIQMAKDVAEVEDPRDLYGAEGDPLTAEYCQRDANVLEFLRTNPDVKAYVEKRVGRSIEAIWNISETGGDTRD